MALQFAVKQNDLQKAQRRSALPVQAGSTFLHHYNTYRLFSLHLSPSPASSSGNCCGSEGFVSHEPADKRQGIFSLGGHPVMLHLT